MAHAFLCAGPGRGPSYVMCGKDYYDDLDVRPDRERQPTPHLLAETRAGPRVTCANKSRRRAAYSFFRSKKRQQQLARKQKDSILAMHILNEN